MRRVIKRPESGSSYELNDYDGLFIQNLSALTEGLLSSALPLPGLPAATRDPGFQGSGVYRQLFRMTSGLLVLINEELEFLQHSAAFTMERWRGGDKKAGTRTR